MSRNSKSTNLLLWTVQALLAALFLFAGGFKLFGPAAALTQGPVHLPVPFLRFIGVAECLGALGLILPGIFGVYRWLTPLAAGGLMLIMSGATTLTAVWVSLGAAAFPLVVGLLCLTVNRARSRMWRADGHRATGADVLRPSLGAR